MSTPEQPQPRPLTLITGAAGGIGSAIVAALSDSALPHDLLLSGRDLPRLHALADPHGAGVLQLDLSRPETFAEALSGLEGVTNLVHNAGVAELGRVDALSHAAWSRTLAVNLVAPAELTRLLLPQIRAARGSVVFINSGAGLSANPEWSAYAASKFGLRALADALRAEEAPHGVRVTSIYPGRTDTQMQREVIAHEGREYDGSLFITPETVAQAVRLVLDLPRDATIPDLTVRPGPH
jgi:NADP-dependent 3-hydroxy acid dehydrogenase YdfG